MKKTNYLLISLLLFCSYSIAQTIVVLQPGSTHGNDAFVWDYQPNSNFGSNEGLDVTGWTAASTPYISRALLQFDLSSIPAGAVIVSAHLTLYHNNTSTNYNGIHSGANESFLQRVTGNWQQSSVTWNNQPATTTLNQLTLPATTSGSQDFTNIDVKNLVEDMIANPATSFGFMLGLQTEQPYRDLLFAASEHPNASLHPKLEITFVTGLTCLTIQPNYTEGKDAFVWNYHRNTNYGYSEALDVTGWTASGTPYKSRVFIQFDLSSVPTDATVISANLSLYHNNTTTNYSGLHNGANESFIRKVSGNWDENTVNWNNQPATTSTNQVSLPASTSGTQNFLNIDVKDIAAQMVKNPASNFGFMMRLQTEHFYRDLIFASSEHSNTSLLPKIEICYCYLPDKPGAITAVGGNTKVCSDDTKTYSIAAVNGATSYNWTPPAGGVIISGQGTTSATINFTSAFVASDSIKVVAVNGCGSGKYRALKIRKGSPPVQPAAITGVTTVCANQSGVPYSIVPDATALNYTWTAPTGSHINDGVIISTGATLITTATNVTVSYGATSGNLKVRANNSCGSGSYKIEAITFNCRDAGNISSLEASIFPNPADNEVAVSFVSAEPLPYSIKLHDIIGKTLLGKSGVSKTGENIFKLSVDKIDAGICTVEIKYGNKIRILKLVVR